MPIMIFYVFLFMTHNILNFFRLFKLRLYGGELKKPIIIIDDILFSFNPIKNAKTINIFSQINSYIVIYTLINFKNKKYPKDAITNNLASLFIFSKPLWVMQMIISIIDSFPKILDLLKKKSFVVHPYIVIDYSLKIINNHNINNITQYYLIISNMRIYYDKTFKINGYLKYFSKKNIDEYFILRRFCVNKVHGVSHLHLGDKNLQVGMTFTGKENRKIIGDKTIINNLLFGKKINEDLTHNNNQYMALNITEPKSLDCLADINIFLKTHHKITDSNDLLGFILKTNLLFYLYQPDVLVYQYRLDNKIVQEEINVDKELTQEKRMRLIFLLNSYEIFQKPHFRQALKKISDKGVIDWLINNKKIKIVNVYRSSNKDNIIKELQKKNNMQVFEEIREERLLNLEELIVGSKNILNNVDKII